MKCLNNWTIDLDKLPKYCAFRNTMCLKLDKKVLQAFMKTDATYVRHEQKEIIKNIVEAMSKNSNFLKIKHTQAYDIGRFYCSTSPIVLSRHIKHTLFHSLGWIDIDMVKGHPTILYNVAMNNGIKLAFFKFYIENPDSLLTKIQKHYIDEVPNITKDDVKDIFSILIYGGSYQTWLTQMELDGKPIKNTPQYDYIASFQKECRKVIELVYNSNEAILHKVKGKETNENDLKKRVMSYFCGIIENEILYTCFNVLKKENVINPESVALEYDGMCFKRPDDFSDEDLDYVLNKVNDTIKAKTGLEVKMAWKKYAEDKIHEDILEIAKNLEDEEDNDEEDETEKLEFFDKVSKDFEATHCKIVNQGVFVKQTEDEAIIMSKQQIVTSYEHLVYKRIVKNKKGQKEEKKNFIADWIRNNPKQRCYDDIGCFPTGIRCPKNTFNTWVKFPMELVEEYEHKEEELQILLKHIEYLSGNNKDVADYIVKWVAQMIQYPAIKTICPTFISKQGAGKGAFLKCLAKMLGEKKVIETATPSRDIWGDFNGRMANTFLINLNELSKKETIESEGRIKQLITDPKITINNKGVSQYDINSYHRFIITTNKEDPIATSNDDRRKLIIRSSDEKCGDKEYFKKLYDMLDDTDVIKTIYEYFKSIPDMDKFNSLPIPKTEYQKNLEKLSVSPIEQWLESFVFKNINETEITVSSDAVYKDFTKWASIHCEGYKLKNIQFAVALNNLRISGVTKGQATSKGNTKLFNIVELKKHFGIDCAIESDDDDEDAENTGDDSGCFEEKL